MTQLGYGKPIEFLMRWIDKESGGNACDYTSLFEAGIGQLDPANQASVGTNADEQHPSPPCVPGQRSIVPYSALTDEQRVNQVAPWLRYVDLQIDRARTELAQYGYNWPETSTSFWSMVKMGHVAPARIPVMLAQGIAGNGGVPPADWNALMATGPFPNTPINWTNNAGDVGSYASGFKLIGSVPTWFALGLGVAGFFGLLFTVRYVKKRYPDKYNRVRNKLHLPEKMPLFGLPDPSDQDWSVATDAIYDHQPKKAAQVFANIRHEHGYVSAPPEFLKALHEVPWDVRWKFEDYANEYLK